MLKYGEVNPLNVHGIRRVNHCPPHFVKILFDLRSSEKAITDWVYENLEGRFWMGDRYIKLEDGTITFKKGIGFELGSEASYFSMFLDKINKSNWS